MWQFDELGYDIHIDFNGRVGNKPLPWGPDGLGYYEDPLRRYIYDAYKGILMYEIKLVQIPLLLLNSTIKIVAMFVELLITLLGKLTLL